MSDFSFIFRYPLMGVCAMLYASGGVTRRATLRLFMDDGGDGGDDESGVDDDDGTAKTKVQNEKESKNKKNKNSGFGVGGRVSDARLLELRAHATMAAVLLSQIAWWL
jgi:hypothetical protein